MADENESVTEVPTRPENVPEKFWNAETGTVNTDDVLGAYTSLQSETSKLFGGKPIDEFKTEVETAAIERFQSENVSADRPETPEGYEVAFENDFLPENVSFTPDPENPMFKWWKDQAHKAGLGQEGFMEGIKAYALDQMGNLPNREAIAEALGENGEARIQSTQDWLQATLSPESYEHATRLIASPGGIEVLEELQNKGGKIDDGANGGNGNGGVKTREELRTMQNDPKYWDPKQRDLEYIKQVRAEYAKTFPGRQNAAG